MSQTLSAKAEAIANQYLEQLPPDYCSRYSAIADPGVLEILFKGRRHGLTLTACCEAAGISPRTYQRWQQEAEAYPEGPYGSFVAALKQEQRQGQLKRLEQIEKHGNAEAKQWTALAWINERTDPEQFALRKDESNGPKVIVQIGIKDSDVSISTLSPVPRNDLQP